jgi:class 3 adenylate cyclase/tetratricopeptide (TPR) repeat protein
VSDRAPDGGPGRNVDAAAHLARVAKTSERRQATVLFADISGFTAMSEKLDPEAVTDVVNRCFRALDGIVAAHGGHVDKYIGDCVMALFGVPAALERAPQQAINAAIEMRHAIAELNRTERLPVRLDMHIGVNTGLVIAGNVGGDVKQEFTVVGDAVNLAARLKDAAPTGSIWAGPDTHRYAREEFEFKKLPPLTVKGKDRPIDAWEVTSTESIYRPRPVGAERLISSPLVGRDAELRLLEACLAAVARGEGGIVNLVGEAGLGKSRLLAEAFANETARDVRVLEARSLAVGPRTGFLAFVCLLKNWAGILDDDDEAHARAKLDAAVAALVPDEADDVFPFLATLMGLRLQDAAAARVAGIAGDALEKLITRSMRELLRRLAAERPLALVFDDLHWADQSSIQLLAALLRLVPDEPILFIHAFRPDQPETSDRILALSRAEHGRHQIEIDLAPLDARDCQTFVRNLLKTDDLPYSLQTLVGRTGDGNPFYIEEVVRSLLDEGLVETVKGRLTVSDKVDSLVVPGTVQGVIMARVDRLTDEARGVLQLASVLGRSFYQRILARMVPPEVDLGAALAYLKERQLVSERKTRRTAAVRRSTLAEETEYVFQHALVQDTIYESILQKTRKEQHLKAAQAIEALFADRLPDFYGMLAYHFSRAEHLEKAEEYLFKAGDEAARAAASSEALGFFREASKVYFLINGEGGDPKKKALLEKSIALALLNTGELTESIAHFNKALEYLGEPVPRGTLADVARWAVDLGAVLFHVYLRAGRHRAVKALEHEREVCELYFQRGRAQTTSDPRAVFLQLPTGLRRLNRIDPREVDEACGMYVGCAGLFAYSGISFGISARMLEIAKSLVREGSVIDEFVYREVCFIHHYLRGSWDDEHAIDAALVDEDLRYGQLWDVTSYLGLECDRRLRRGDFATATRLLAELGEINDSYGYTFAGTTREGMTAVLLIEQRRLEHALRTAESYQGARHEEALRVFGLGLVAKVQLLRGEREAAAAALARAEEILKRAALVSRWQRSTYLVARLLFDATALEEAATNARPLARAARRSIRRALAVTASVAKERVEILCLAARVEWAAGRRRRALGYWRRAIAEGERLGARPELARTWMELGHRLGTETLDGVDGPGWLRRAEETFAALGLDWDLAHLRGAARADEATRRAAADG